MKVSVALCTYNGEKYLEEQLQSIVDQTRRPDEVVVCDDRSTDDTITILQEFSEQYNDIFDIHINNENKGVSQNFCDCISKCTGDVIALSDQDDVWKHEKLGTQIETYKQLEDKENSVVFHDAWVTDEELTPMTNLWSLYDFQYSEERNSYRDIRDIIKRNFVQGASILLDSGLKQYLSTIPGDWIHDQYIAMMAAFTGKLVGIDEKLAFYRQHSNQTTDLQTRLLKNPVSVLRRYSSNAKKMRETCQSRATDWTLLKERVEEIPEVEFTVSKHTILHHLEERRVYECKRSEAYDATRTLERFAIVFDNIYGYLKYESGIDRIKFLLADAFIR